MLDESVYHFRGCLFYFYFFIYLMENLVTNNIDSDQTLHYVASDLAALFA